MKPDDVKARDNLGYVLLKMNRVEEASRQFDEAIRLDPRYGPARVNAGNVRLQSGRLADAVAHYEVALANPAAVDLAHVHNHLGVAFAMQGQTARAVTHFREALRIRPDYAEARANLARASGS